MALSLHIKNITYNMALFCVLTKNISEISQRCFNAIHSAQPLNSPLEQIFNGCIYFCQHRFNSHWWKIDFPALLFFLPALLCIKKSCVITFTVFSIFLFTLLCNKNYTSRLFNIWCAYIKIKHTAFNTVLKHIQWVNTLTQILLNVKCMWAHLLLTLAIPMGFTTPATSLQQPPRNSVVTI